MFVTFFFTKLGHSTDLSIKNRIVSDQLFISKISLMKYKQIRYWEASKILKFLLVAKKN